MAANLEQLYIDNNYKPMDQDSSVPSIIISVASGLAASFLEESLRERKGAEIPSLRIKMVRTDAGNHLVSQVEG